MSSIVWNYKNHHFHSKSKKSTKILFFSLCECGNKFTDHVSQPIDTIVNGNYKHTQIYANFSNIAFSNFFVHAYLSIKKQEKFENEKPETKNEKKTKNKTKYKKRN